MAVAMQYHSKGLAFFDDVVNEDDFLEFLIEWSDSIVPAEGAVNHSTMSEAASSINSKTWRQVQVITAAPQATSTAAVNNKRKLDELTSSFPSSFFQPFPMLRKVPDPDAELGKLPILLFEAFNAGDLQYIREKINENLTLSATLKTMMIDQPLVGRHNCYNFLHALSVSHPDMVFVLKNVRLTGKHGEGGGRCVKFKYYFTGTNAFPSAAESYYYNKKDYLNKYLDYSQLSEKDKNSVHLLVDHHKSHGTPYVCFGRGSAVFDINPSSKISAINFEWKLTSICSPVPERKLRQ